MRTINDIAEGVRRGERISVEDALVLFREAPLWLLGELATERKIATSGNKVYYNRNVHLEPTNICLFNCEFCSFRRREGDPDAWYMSVDDVEARARELRDADITEVHIVGGVHPKHDLDTYCAMIRRVKGVLPHVSVKAYTAVEIFYMIRHAGVPLVEGLRRLVDAGMECIPGGGAEIFDAELRRKICPDKCSAEEWLAVHRVAHNMGVPTNCTMLYGHVESLEQRIDHLNRLRMLQDEAPGFDAFVPLKYHSRNNRLSAAGECSVEEDLRMIALSRIFLDNIPHIKAYWVSYGRATTEMALHFGADDIDGTIGDTTKIYSMAGGQSRPSMSVEELETMVRNAGFEPVERDSFYNAVEHVVSNDTESVESIEMANKPNDETMISNDNKPREIKSVKRRVQRSASKNIQKSDSKRRRSATGMTTGGRLSELYRRYPLISHVVLILLFGLLVVMGVYVGLKVGTRHNDVIKVPNFLGVNIDKARSIADERGLNIVVRDSVFDVDLPGGTIMDQLPRTSDVRDVTVKPGRKIYVTINAYNRRMVDVPYVAKQTLRQAINQLERAGLTIEKLVYEADMTSTDYVLRQEVDGRDVKPESGVKMPIGTGVTLYVSYRFEEGTSVVPRLVGLTLNQAENVLWNSGFNVGNVDYDNSVEDIVAYRRARVVKQSRAHSVAAKRGSSVSLTLSCDMEMVDSLKAVVDAEVKLLEKQRRKAQEELRKAQEAAKGVE